MWTHTKAYKAGKEKAKANENKVLEAIKQLPIVEGYYCGTFADLAKLTGITQCTARAAALRLYEQDVIVIKQSVGLFGSVHKKGFKILKENENVSKTA